MENSSTSLSSDSSRIVYPSTSFSPVWTILTALGIVVVVFGGVFAGTIAYVAGHVGASQREIIKALTGMYGITVQGVVEIIVLIALLVVLPVLAHMSLEQLGFRAPNARDWPIIAVGVVAMCVIITATAGALSNALHFKNQELAVNVYRQTVGMQRVLFVVFGVLVAPIFEETVFRVFLFNAFRKWFGFAWAAALSGILFGLAHSQPPLNSLAMYVSITVPLALGGVILAFVYERTGKAWASMVTHAGFNALQFVLLTFVPNLAK